MITLTNAEKRTVEGRGVILVFSSKLNRATPCAFQAGVVVHYLDKNYKVVEVEHTRNLFHGGIGDMVGLLVEPVSYEVDTLFRIVYIKDEKSVMYTAFVQEIPGIIVEGKTRGEVRKRILEIMPKMMQDLDPMFTDHDLSSI